VDNNVNSNYSNIVYVWGEMDRNSYELSVSACGVGEAVSSHEVNDVQDVNSFSERYKSDSNYYLRRLVMS
jgi:hypothetical protein